MPRQSKRRLVCGEPVCRRFLPQDPPGEREEEPIRLSVEELESLRLCDLEELEQGEAAEQMGVSRGTLQRILYAARKKTAQALVAGAELAIGGGRYAVRREPCPGRGRCRSCALREKSRISGEPADGRERPGCCERAEPGIEISAPPWQDHENFDHRKDAFTVKIAVTLENGQVFQHFGHTKTFLIAQAEGDTVSTSILDAQGSGHGALASLLKANGVQVLICGGIGGGAKAALQEAGIELVAGASGNAEEQVRAYLDGTLKHNPAVACAHHDHGHGGHSCGGHHEEGHSCAHGDCSHGGGH